jgi:hypothetical protein
MNEVSAEAADIVTVVLEGGPATLQPEQRRQCITNPPPVIKICFNGGHEHFARSADIEHSGGPVTYRWTDRTRIAE